MEFNDLKKSFRDAIEAFDFIAKYRAFDMEFSQRDWKTIEKEKVDNADAKKMFKVYFPDYQVSYKHGGFYLEKTIDSFQISINIQIKGNVLLPYMYVYYVGNQYKEIINKDDNLVTPTGIAQFIAKDYTLIVRPKLYQNLAELQHLAVNEVSFYESFLQFFFSNISV